jgi:tRNA pseudouridine32 synthase/23S rRNA pseudouridine746 synthase
MTTSRLYLPKLESPPLTVVEYLYAHFPRIDPSIWRDRVSRGVVTLSDGTTVKEDSPYRYGIFVFYRREVLSEPAPVEDPRIIHRDDDILVVDKPHGMPVTPVGQHVERSLLACLQKMTGLETLAPMHRLDRETAGLVLFTTRAEIRGPYHRLFSEHLIDKQYLAVAYIKDAPNQTHWRIENRIERGNPWFRQKIVDGLPNAITEIELLERREDTGLFRLIPTTGKKHQLRLHMASIGFPIVGDSFYPEIEEKREGDPPLQLLAHRLAFVDPRSGEARSFVSGRGLWGVVQLPS